MTTPCIKSRAHMSCSTHISPGPHHMTWCRQYRIPDTEAAWAKEAEAMGLNPLPSSSEVEKVEEVKRGFFEQQGAAGVLVPAGRRLAGAADPSPRELAVSNPDGSTTQIGDLPMRGTVSTPNGFEVRLTGEDDFGEGEIDAVAVTGTDAKSLSQNLKELISYGPIGRLAGEELARRRLGVEPAPAARAKRRPGIAATILYGSYQWGGGTDDPVWNLTRAVNEAQRVSGLDASQIRMVIGPKAARYACLAMGTKDPGENAHVAGVALHLRLEVHVNVWAPADKGNRVTFHDGPPPRDQILYEIRDVMKAEDPNRLKLSPSCWSLLLPKEFTPGDAATVECGGAHASIRPDIGGGGIIAFYLADFKSVGPRRCVLRVHTGEAKGVYYYNPED